MSTRRIAAYYAATGDQYDEYSGAARGWHWGIWQPNVRTHQQSLIRSNEILARGLDLSRRSRVLDVGCGSGGFAIWAAKRFGCHVTGITICAEHVPRARRNARRSGVGDRCEFHEMDMDRLRRSHGDYDLVVNQESFCYSRDKARYVESVFEVLAPGGNWRCIDTCLVPGRQSGLEARDLRAIVYAGFAIPSFLTIAGVERALRRARFAEIDTVDLTKEVLPNRRRFEAVGPLPVALATLFPEWSQPGSPTVRLHRSGSYRGGYALLTGLARGYFRHVLHRARRPLA